MSEVVLFPDAVLAVVLWLRTKLPTIGATGIPVGTRVPNPRPAAFVRCLAVGGNIRNRVVMAETVIVEAWAADEEAASLLARRCHALMQSAIGQTGTAGTFYRVDEFAGPGFLPDPDSDQARYTFTISVALRGTVS